MNESTNKIPGSELRKLIKKTWQASESRIEECHEIEGVVQERNMNWTRHEEDSMKG